MDEYGVNVEISQGAFSEWKVFGKDYVKIVESFSQVGFGQHYIFKDLRKLKVGK